MIFFRQLVLWIFLLLFYTASGQNYAFRNFSIADGLPQSQVNCVLEDSRSLLWMGTFGGGLTRFDGSSFTAFTTAGGLSSNVVTSLLEDENGILWIGTEKGLCFYDGAALQWVSDYNGPRRAEIRALAAGPGSGELWIGTMDGKLFRRQGGKYKSVATDGSPIQCMLRKDQTLYLGTGNGLSIWDGNNVVPATDTSLQGVSITDISKDSDGNIWLACFNKGLARIGADRGVQWYTTENGLRDIRLVSVHCATGGSVWGGTFGGGVSVFDGHSFRHYGESQGLPSTRVLDIIEDRWGGIWLGTGGGGLAQAFISQFSRYTTEDGLSGNNVTALLRDSKSRIWIGTGGSGLNLFSGGVITPVKGTSGMQIQAMAEDGEGNIWLAAGRSGLFKIPANGVHGVKMIPAEKNLSFITVFRGPGGEMYAGAYRKGLARISGTKLNWLEEFKSKSIYAATVSGGSLWVAVYGEGIFFQENGGWKKIAEKDGLSTSNIHALVADGKNTVYAGTTGGGIIRIGRDSIRSFGPADGLSSSNCVLLFADTLGHVIGGSERGLDIFHLDETSGQLQIVSFTARDGFTAGESNYRAILSDTGGSFLIGTPDGLFRFSMEGAAQMIAPPPHVMLTGLELFHQPPDWQILKTKPQPWFPLPEATSFAWNRNHFTFHFSGRGRRSGEDMRYSWLLEGYDAEWSPPVNISMASYPKLPPGSYVFMVRAVDDLGAMSKEPATYAFTIRAPLWMRPWFYAGVLVTGVLLVYLLVRMRERRQMRRAAELENEVAVRTAQLREEKDRAERAMRIKSEFLATMSHEIRTPLNGVIGIADLMAQSRLSTEQASLLGNIRYSSESLLQLINDILDFSRIESGNLELDNKPFSAEKIIVQAIESVAQQVHAKGLFLWYETSPDLPEWVSGDSLRVRQILLNLISNAVKFTERGEICVQVHKMSSARGECRVCIRVRDSGIGIPADKMESIFGAFTQADSGNTRRYGGSGLGLAICQKLVLQMKGSIRAESEPGKGSVFIAEIVLGEVNDAKPQQPALNQKEVFVALKHPGLQQAVIQWLKLAGAQVRAFQDGAALAQQLAVKTGTFVLLDADRVKETGGAEVAAKMQKLILLGAPDLLKELQEKFSSRYSFRPLNTPLTRTALLEVLSASEGDAASVQEDQVQAKSVFLPQTVRILLAEDNVVNQLVAVKMLATMGLSADVAENGQLAVEAMQEKPYDIVLMDVMMPEMDGLDATREIRRQFTPERPVIIAVTANAMPEDRDICIQAGMNDYISKPVSVDVLRSTLMKWGLNFKPASENQTSRLPMEPSAHKHVSLDSLKTIAGGDEAFIPMLLGKIVKTLPVSFETMEKAVSGQNWPELKAAAHKAKSTFAYLDLQDMRSKLQDIEHLAMDQLHLDTLPGKVQEAVRRGREILAELEDILSKLK